MKLFYYKENNFGDQLNTWLWDQLIPGVLDDDESTAFIGIGTLLNDRLPLRTKNARLRVIFGTGVGYGQGIPQIDDSYKIYCLRGPLSAQALGIENKFALTDGAILIRKLYNFTSKKLYKFSYMPHHNTDGEGWRLVCEKLGFGYIDPHWPREKVLSSISQSEVILAEAMHGAIIADAFRIPWIPVISHSTILSFKWQDWCQSIDVEYKPSYINRLHHPRQKLDILSPVRLVRDWARQRESASQLLTVARTVNPTLSSDTKVENLTQKMYERLQEFKQDTEKGVLS
ncbi:polysaccharide pyruvyl transferase family protein [Nostoc sp. UHCC 0870]|uniref:polysaccharide pyruvyl transferase family protein n=1 Tax=Nostoc sp. UHCC 0870 TaxID=2914041 RepID=UPI001EDD0D8C|nr:polysaccharide pyruvyl transferase family protein [Nostoc sp. UHCC 0870]UKO99773.1 polysaccharide pyruvyl transferase family protein [Nostoc sp. UHCC 0870]